jgi:hypothetical protein
MKWVARIATVGLAMVMVGCQTYLRTQDQMRADNAEPVQSLFDAQDQAGIIATRAVFAHHFVSGTATLNERGVEVLETLSEYYKANPGELGMPRRDESEAVYKARVERVTTFLAENGVDTATVQITLDRPKAGGITSTEMRAKLEAERQRSIKKDQQGGGAAGVMMQALGAGGQR